MIERYLFRGKRHDTGEWIYGDLSRPGNGVFIFEPQKTFFGHADSHRIDPATIGQCTGLTDKNGKLIFESDILTDDRDWRGVVKWYPEGRWLLESFAKGERYIGYVEQCPARQNSGNLREIIGNIHDNPEFLNGGEEV